MSDLFGNHIVGFTTRRLILLIVIIPLCHMLQHSHYLHYEATHNAMNSDVSVVKDFS